MARPRDGQGVAPHQQGIPHAPVQQTFTIDFAPTQAQIPIFTGQQPTLQDDHVPSVAVHVGAPIVPAMGCSSGLQSQGSSASTSQSFTALHHQSVSGGLNEQSADTKPSGPQGASDGAMGKSKE